jgi:hypothetical protein
MFRTPAIFQLQARTIARGHIGRADCEPKIKANIAEVGNGMERRHNTAAEDGLTPKNREDLERTVVRLLDVATRCGEPAIQYELMELANELAKLIEAE